MTDIDRIWFTGHLAKSICLHGPPRGHHDFQICCCHPQGGESWGATPPGSRVKGWNELRTTWNTWKGWLHCAASLGAFEQSGRVAYFGRTLAESWNDISDFSEFQQGYLFVKRYEKHTKQLDYSFVFFNYQEIEMCFFSRVDACRTCHHLRGWTRRRFASKPQSWIARSVGGDFDSSRSR